VSRALRIGIPVGLAMAAGLFALLWPKAEAPEEPPPPAAPTPSNGRPPPDVTTGTLVVRVLTSDGVPPPDDAVAGYVEGRDRRLRALSPERTVRYSDVRLDRGRQTRVEAVAEAPGYFPASADVHVSPNVPAEVVLTLERRP
jgi:hypothetical protein